LILKILPVGMFVTNCYLLGCPRTGDGLVIDPGAEGERILKLIREMNLKIKAVVNTHGHIDHILANARIKAETGAPPLMWSRADYNLYQKPGFPVSLLVRKLPSPDGLIDEGDTINFGDYRLQVLSTPGHTPGSICLYGQQVIFTGDTLFAGSVGRTEPGLKETLLDSIKHKILPMDNDTAVYSGHGPSTSIIEEKKHNPFVKEVFH